MSKDGEEKPRKGFWGRVRTFVHKKTNGLQTWAASQAERNKMRATIEKEKQRRAERRKQQMLNQFRPTVGVELREGDDLMPVRRRNSLREPLRAAGGAKAGTSNAPRSLHDRKQDYLKIKPKSLSRSSVRPPSSMSSSKPSAPSVASARTDRTQQSAPPAKPPADEQSTQQTEASTASEATADDDDDDFIVDFQTVNEYQEGAITLMEPNTAKPKMRVFGRLKDLRKSEVFFDRKTAVYTNTVRSVLALMGESGSALSKERPPPTTITWKPVTSVRTYRKPREPVGDVLREPLTDTGRSPASPSH